MGRTYREIKIQTDLPEGWLPEEYDSIYSVTLSAPYDVDAHGFSIRLPTGEERRFAFTDGELIRADVDGKKVFHSSTPR